jgi:hypothetical protein
MSGVGHQSSMRVRHGLPGLLEIIGHLGHRGLRQTTS